MCNKNIHLLQSGCAALLRCAVALVNLLAMKQYLAGGLVLALSVTGLARAGELPARAAGLWQSTTSVMGPDGKPMAQAQNVVTVTCVDALTDRKLLLSGQSHCSSLTVSGSGSSYEINGVCTQAGAPVAVHEALTYNGDKSMQLNATFKNASGTMSLTSNLQWISACPAGVQPGDEGSMVNGAFSKAGNVNDAIAP